MKLINKAKSYLSHKYNNHLFGHLAKFQNNSSARVIKRSEILYPYPEISPEESIKLGLGWLNQAHIAVGKKGFSSKYALSKKSFVTNYPETSGYTLCTLLALMRNKAVSEKDSILIKEMIISTYTYLLSIQQEIGSFTGGREGMANYGIPNIFNAGQILLGLTDLAECGIQLELITDSQKKELDRAIERCARFMSDNVEHDGKLNTQYTFRNNQGSYHTRSTYGLIRAALYLNNIEYVQSAKRHINFVVNKQRKDGWIDDWSFTAEFAVLHTTVYTLRGILEASLLLDNRKFLDAVIKGVEHLYYYPSSWDGLPPSHLNSEGSVIDQLCITGLSQLSIVLSKLYEKTGNELYKQRFNIIVSAITKFQIRDEDNNINGAMPASWPPYGKYQANDLIEWGIKFHLDSMLIASGVTSAEIKG